MVALGVGDKKHITFGAYEQIRKSDFVYVMAKPGSWMILFSEEIAGKDKIRSYMPSSVKWNSGWEKDPVFAEIANEVEALVAKGKHITFAMAGDISIYGNIADSVIPLLRERGLSWDIYPGVSFLNAISCVTGEPIVREADNLAVISARVFGDVDAAFLSADVVAIYNPSDFKCLREYIIERKITYAKMILAGTYGKKGKLCDLLVDREITAQGIVVLRKPDVRQIPLPVDDIAMPQRAKRVVRLHHHLGLNGWDSHNRFFVVCFPDRLMWSQDGCPDNIEIRYKFAGDPADIRGFFIGSEDDIYVSLKGFNKGSFGRTFVSTDSGKTFRLAFEQCFWGMDEDLSNNLFAGIYHERTEPDRSCSVLWSPDRGKIWVDIADPLWKNQYHVHHVAVNPLNGWLYACLGDKIGLRGCWRSKVMIFSTSMPCDVGACEISFQQRDNLNSGDVLLTPSGISIRIVSVSDFSARLEEPLKEPLPLGSLLWKLDWKLKFADPDNSLQFIGICVKDDYIYLSNDTSPAFNKKRVAVYRGKDDGADGVVMPEEILIPPKEYGWGSFFLECDSDGGIWTGVRPVRGKGGIWFSDDGVNWQACLDASSEDIPCWRGTHTYRDGSLGQTGYGRNLMKQSMITTLLNFAVQIEPD